MKPILPALRGRRRPSSVATVAAAVATTAAALLTFAPRAEAQSPQSSSILPHATLATQQFGNDAPWFERNIPFFECSDSELEQVYYYRWKLYKAHLKDLGKQGYIVTEFLDNVGWALYPTQSLNDATAFHIHEGRWLRDPQYVNDYIDFMYAGGGNDRHFSEAIADAVYADYLATGNRAAATRHLDAMQYVYNRWDDHYDFGKRLYFIEPLLDATEYSIASINASGGKDGFRGGDAFRPSINSFMYADAVAISKLAALNGDPATAADFAARAESLRREVQASLWNDNLQHFVDRYQVSNKSVRYWDFVNGRELEGFTPWYFHLPDADPKYNAAWTHLLSPAELGGPFGIRTVEPTYEYYMRQYRYDQPTGKPECQWNGPSWPFQTTLALGGMANLLDDYTQTAVHTDDYLRLLKQYAHQHYTRGRLDLQEDYNPDTGEIIVGLGRSDHYNHSSFNDLIVTGLCGLRPRADNVLEVHPLVPTGANSLTYFCLEDIPYHGQLITILYDRDGTRYHRGAGLSVYINGRRVVAPRPLARVTAPIPAPPTATLPTPPRDLAVNMLRYGFPAPSASTDNTPDSLYQAIDGRVWYYPEVRNFWTNTGSQSPTDWFALDFGQPTPLASAKLYFYADGTHFKAPTRYTLQSWTGADWTDIPNAHATPAQPLENGENTVTFLPIVTSKLRVRFENPAGASVALVELKVFSPTPPAPSPIGNR